MRALLALLLGLGVLGAPYRPAPVLMAPHAGHHAPEHTGQRVGQQVGHHAGHSDQPEQRGAPHPHDARCVLCVVGSGVLVVGVALARGAPASAPIRALRARPAQRTVPTTVRSRAPPALC